MTTKMTELPHFVRKQVELAIPRLIQGLLPSQVVAEIHGRRVLLIELKPHPFKPESLRVPLALFDFVESHWVLLFRGSQGQWQTLPNDHLLSSFDAKVDAVLADDYRVFWRQ